MIYSRTKGACEPGAMTADDQFRPARKGLFSKWLVCYENHNTNNKERNLQLVWKTWTQMNISLSHTWNAKHSRLFCLIRKKKFGVCISIETDLHITLSGKAPNTHLQRRGPRLTLCPRRRCSSGVEKLRLTQTHGTLQNRHVKSQARESHWKKNRDVVQREDKAAARTVHHQCNLCSFRCVTKENAFLFA